MRGQCRQPRSSTDRSFLLPNVYGWSSYEQSLARRAQISCCCSCPKATGLGSFVYRNHHPLLHRRCNMVRRVTTTSMLLLFANVRNSNGGKDSGHSFSAFLVFLRSSSTLLLLNWSRRDMIKKHRRRQHGGITRRSTRYYRYWLMFFCRVISFSLMIMNPQQLLRV